MAASLAQFIFDIVRFLSYGTEDKPFPFQSWPEVAIEEEPEVAETPVAATVEELVEEPESASSEEK